MSVSPQPLCPEFSVCGQITVADVAHFAEQGVRSIINNRPDGEGGPSQPTSAQIEAAARAAGLRYVHFPVSSPALTPEQVQAYRHLCADLPHPIVAFCRSGARAAAFFQACGGRVGGGC